MNSINTNDEFTRNTQKVRKVFVIDDGESQEREPSTKKSSPTSVDWTTKVRKRKMSTKEVKESKKMNSLASTFFKKSSVYALSQVGNSKTIRRKVFWSLILIGGIIGCCSQVYRYLSAYYEYPVVINIDAINTFNQQFPGITICNLNMIQVRYFACLIDRVPPSACNPTNESDAFERWKALKWQDTGCFKQNRDQLSDDFIERMRFLSLYYSLNESSQIAYGHQPDKFIRSCKFNGDDCSYKNFTIFLDNMFGNCFTFNNANDTTEPLKTSFIGPSSGLILELNVESEEYVWFSQSVGARVVVHDPYHEPTPQDRGVNVSPGFETTIGMFKVMMRRLGYPYKDKCKRYNVTDSKKKCDFSCYQESVSALCNCSQPGTALQAERYCRFDNITELCCVYLARNGPNSQTSDCSCPLECESSDFEMKISSGMWPAKPENMEGAEHYMSLETIRENWIKVRIYFDTLEQLTYDQKPMFEDSEVLSQIGGQMGLWLGLSLAAMFECLENLILFWHYRRNRKQDGSM